jgi:hypothetical protein
MQFADGYGTVVDNGEVLRATFVGGVEAEVV